MSTGYTYKVEEGKITELSDFVLECARGFMPFIHQREENGPNRLPTLDTSYNSEQLAFHKEKLASFLALSKESRMILWDEEYKNAVKAHDDYIAVINKRNERYDAMIEKVLAWAPPTSEHVKLKEFMLSQLTSSKDDPYDAPKQRSFEKWQTDFIEWETREIDYCEKNLKQQKSNYEFSVAWITQLYNSLGLSPPGP
jgi:hypothetical protein